MMEKTFSFGTDEKEFEHYVGRKPKDKNEFLDWVRLVEKGVQSQVDWDVIGECAKEEIMKRKE